MTSDDFMIVPISGKSVYWSNFEIWMLTHTEYHKPTSFYDEFAKLLRATICFVISVLVSRLSVRMEQLGSHWTDFHEI